MAKQEKLEFDYEEYFDSLFETTAVLAWSTHIPVYTFAYYLNLLYGINLERKNNIVLKRKSGPLECKLYYYQDNVMHHTYFLVENNVTPTGRKRNKTFFDKILLVMGPDSYSIAHSIYEEFDSHSLFGNKDFSDDPMHNALCHYFVHSGILENAFFDFSDPETPDTTYFPVTSGNEELMRKRALFLVEQREFITDILLAVDYLIPDYEDDLCE